MACSLLQPRDTQAPFRTRMVLGLLSEPGSCSLILQDAAGCLIRLTDCFDFSATGSVMKFWFCETCGKRLTDQDLEAGAARNKQLHGVFCQDCALGVQTLETMPVTEAQARAILKKTPPGQVSKVKNELPDHEDAAAPSTRAATTNKAAKPAAQNINVKPLVIGVGAGLVGALILIIAIGSKAPAPQQQPVLQPAPVPAPRVDVPKAEAPNAPHKPSPAPPPPIAAPQIPAVAAPAVKTSVAQEPAPEPKPEPSPADGLVAHWKLDDATGTTAADASGNGNTGTLVKGPVWTTGKINGALKFDNTDDRVITAVVKHNVGEGDFTWALWVNPHRLSNPREPLVGNGAFSPGLYCRIGTAGQWGMLWGGDKPSGNTLTLDKWHHLVAVRQKGVVSFYQDGVKTSQTHPATFSMPNAPFILGTSGGTNYSNATLDDVRFYARALSGAEVEALANPPEVPK